MRTSCASMPSKLWTMWVLSSIQASQPWHAGTGSSHEIISFLQGTRWKEFVFPLLSRQSWYNGSIQTIRTCEHQGPPGRDDAGVCSFWTYSEAHPASEWFIVRWQWWWRRSRIIARQQQDVTPTTKDSFLQSYGLSTLSITMIARWMHASGLRFKKREKHHFVDGHECPETIAYRPIFTKKYLNMRFEHTGGSRSLWYNCKKWNQTRV